MAYNNSYNGNDNCEQDSRECEAMRKIFVGGISKRTSEEDYAAHFAKFGKILDSVVMKDRETNESRGFGFVTFDCSDAVENVFQNRPHDLDGKTMDCKRAMPREFNTESAHAKVTRLFVGGVSPDLTKEDLQSYIDSRHSNAGQIKSVDILAEKGIGFIECDSPELADRLVISEQSFTLKGKKMNIKKAEQKRSEGGGAPRGGGGDRSGMRGGRGGGDRGGRGGGDRGGRGGGYSSGNQGGGQSGGYGGQSGGQSGGYGSQSGGQSGGYGGLSGGQSGGYGSQSGGQSGGYGGQSGSYGGQSGGYGGQSGGYGGQPGGQSSADTYANLGGYATPAAATGGYSGGYTAPASGGYAAPASVGYAAPASGGGYGASQPPASSTGGYQSQAGYGAPQGGQGGYSQGQGGYGQ